MAKTTPARGFGVTCPKCHNEDATISLDLNDVHMLTCSYCEEAFSAEEARDLAAAALAKWDAVCRWVALAAPTSDVK